MRCDRIVVLAAGRASRMKRSADGAQGSALWIDDAQNRPKPMIRVGPNGEPMIQFIMDQALRAGFTEATLVIGSSDEVTEPFLDQWNTTPAGPKMRIRCVVQASPLGTGDAVRSALQNDPVPAGMAWVLCNGDNLPTRSALACRSDRRMRATPTGMDSPASIFHARKCSADSSRPSNSRSSGTPCPRVKTMRRISRQWT